MCEICEHSKKDEGEVQKTRYERTLAMNKLEPIRTNNSLTGNVVNDGSSVFSVNDSSAGLSESVRSGLLTKIKVNGRSKASFHKQNYPYKYYKNTASGRQQYIKRSVL